MADDAIPKIIPREMPLPEKRKKATATQVRDLIKRQNNCCALCPVVLVLRDADGGFLRILQPFQIDHIQRLDALGAQTIDNLQALCVGCHKAKTKVDNFEAKKGARIRLEKGQQARRKANGSKLKSRSTFPTQRPLLSLPQSMKPDKAVNGFKWAKTKWPKGRKFRSSTRAKPAQ